MPPTIQRADFVDPRLAAFLQEHLDDMEPAAPPESRHALDLSGLMAPDVRMWVVHDGPAQVGTGALAVVAPGTRKLKSMRTTPACRGCPPCPRIVLPVDRSAMTRSSA
ncbi:GNAT family N-acetyltransferase [Nocardioides sediminis]|uniref:hypothetical protein n=1 Tax=Nocardioides sediminis TaxID=433648 RepID=UPI000D313143|nr:hypothetical protein [Nocardioides sediminis]